MKSKLKYILLSALLLLPLIIAKAQESSFILNEDDEFYLGDMEYHEFGNWEILGLFDPGTGSIILNGQEDQIFTIPTSQNFFKLILDKESGKAVFSNDIYIRNLLEISSGVLNLNGISISLAEDALLSSIPEGLIDETGVGDIRIAKELSDFSLDVGGLGAEITSSANLGNTTVIRGFGIQQFNGVNSISRSYAITPENNSDLNADLVFNYYENELNGIDETLLKLYCSYDSGATWTYVGGTLDADNNSVSLNDISTFGMYTLFPTNYIVSSAGPNGNISPLGDIPVLPGGDQTFVITPDEGYHIDELLVDEQIIAETESYTFYDVTESGHTIDVSFAINTYVITPSVAGNGTIDPSAPVTVEWNNSATFDITAGTGYHIAQILVNGDPVILTGGDGNIRPVNEDNAKNKSPQKIDEKLSSGIAGDNITSVSDNYIYSYQYIFSNVKENYSIHVVFEINEYTLTTFAENGSIEILPSQQLYDHGTEVTLTPVPDFGYHFTGWSGDLDPQTDPAASPLSFIMTADRSITAGFELNTYNILASAGTNGVINPQGNVSVPHGSNKAFTITAQTGYHISRVLVNNEEVSFEGSSSVNPDLGNNIFKAMGTLSNSKLKQLSEFKESAKDNTGVKSKVLPAKAAQSLKKSGDESSIKSETAYKSDELTTAGNQNNATSYISSFTYTFENVISDNTISAEFAINTYTIISSAGENGTITPDSENEEIVVEHFSDIEFSIKAESNYRISGIFVDGQLAVELDDNVTEHTYLFSNISSGHTINAQFEQLLPLASIDPDEWNFGYVETGSSEEHTFILHNEGPGILYVNNCEINGSSDFSLVNSDYSFEVASGEDYEITVAFEPVTAPIAAKTAVLEIYSNDPENEMLSVPLEGYAVPALHYDYTFVADKEVTIEKQLESTGDIFSNDKVTFKQGNPSVSNGNITAVNYIKIEKYQLIRGDLLSGGKIKVDKKSTVQGNKNSNALVQKLVMPSFNFSAGNNDIKVRKKDELTLMPGIYGKVEVESDATIQFLSGDYFIESLKLKKNSKLIANIEDGLVNLNITKDLSFDKNNEVSIVPLGIIGSRWLNFNCSDSKGNIKIDKESIIMGNIIAPESKVHIKKDCWFKGSIVAENINLDQKIKYTPNSTLDEFDSQLNKSINDQIQELIITDFALNQNYPNPFNPSTIISYELPEISMVTIHIYNILGERVKVLVEELQDKGLYKINWEAQNLPSGIYIYSFSANSFKATKKMLLLK